MKKYSEHWFNLLVKIFSKDMSYIYVSVIIINFFFTGYVVKGFFFGFKPVENIYQVLVFISISCFLFLPSLLLNLFGELFTRGKYNITLERERALLLAMLTATNFTVIMALARKWYENSFRPFFEAGGIPLEAVKTEILIVYLAMVCAWALILRLELGEGNDKTKKKPI